MKKNYIFYACAAAALVFASCQKEGPAAEGTEPVSSDLKVITATAMQTKTTTQDGIDVLWENEDKIGLFVSGVSSTEERKRSAVYQTLLDTPSGEAVFTKVDDNVAGTGAGLYYAAYPVEAISRWGSQNAMDNQPTARRCYATIPVEQTAVKGGWDRKAGILAASSMDSRFTFNHAVAYVKFTVSDSSSEFVRLYIHSAAREPMAAVEAAILYGDNNTISVSSNDNPSDYVTLSTPDGEPFENGTYYVAFMPGTFTDGFVFSFEDASGNRATKTVNGALTLDPGDVADAGTVGSLSFRSVLELHSVYAENNVAQGVVFWVNPDNPCRGMVVSTCSGTPIPWATASAVENLLENNDFDEDGTKDAALGATQDKNQTSVENYNIVVYHSDYTMDKYPAIAYCASLRETYGGNWRLPSIEEAGILYNSYYGKAYDAGLTSKKDGSGTNYSEDDDAQKVKQAFDETLASIKAGDTLDGLNSTDTTLGIGAGCWYWLDEETKANGNSLGKNAYVVRMGAYCYNNGTKSLTSVYARCIRDVELQ